MTIKRCYPVLAGASVAENQLVNMPDGTRTISGITTVRSEGVKISYTGTSTARSYIDVYAYTSGDSFLTQFITGHRYLLRAISSDNKLYTVINKPYTDMYGIGRREIIYTPSETPSYFYIRVLATDGEAVNGNGYLQTIDLTQKFGSTIADYLYSLESATAGAGIAKLKEWGFLTDEYIPYNPGALESVEATAHVMRDADENIIGNYSLGTDTLRGLFKLDANNNLYADGDRKEADGTVTRKYGIVDLGTLTWNYNSTDSYFTSFIADMMKNTYASVNLVCSKYPTMPLPLSNLVYGIRYAGGVSSIMVRDSAYTDAATFKAAMSGVYLVYELATPTTEQSTPFASPQVCYPDGTEEFVTSNGVPVGHETKYQL